MKGHSMLCPFVFISGGEGTSFSRLTPHLSPLSLGCARDKPRWGEETGYSNNSLFGRVSQLASVRIMSASERAASGDRRVKMV